jgi:hypothetical protein
VIDCGNESGLNRIVFNVALNSEEFLVVSHQPIIALILPEGLSGKA